MRFVKLFLLGILAYVLSVVFLFPAAPIIERIKPQIQPIILDGISGKLFKGTVATATYNDDILPMQLTDVGWTLAPQTLLKGGVGANISFNGFGGSGKGQVRRQWNGDLVVSGFNFDVQAKELDPLLPLPVAQFAGKITGDIPELIVKNQLLSGVEANLLWSDANVDTTITGFPVKLALGNVTVTVNQVGEGQHKVLLKSSGGELALDGEISLLQNGDFTANVLFTPVANAPRETIGLLQQIALQEANGRFRLQKNGNINQPM